MSAPRLREKLVLPKKLAFLLGVGPQLLNILDCCGSTDAVTTPNCCLCLQTVGTIWDVAISADGVLAATASDDLTVRVWELNGNSCRYVLEGHSGWVVALAFAGDKCVPWPASGTGRSILEQGQNHAGLPACWSFSTTTTDHGSTPQHMLVIAALAFVDYICMHHCGK